MVDEVIADSTADDVSADVAEEVPEDQSESEVEASGEAQDGQEAEEAEAGEAEAEDAEGDDQPSAEEVIETVKVEFDGEEFEVPRKIKDALMRDQDYTHKTQDLAEKRKSFEAEQEDFRQYAEFSRAHQDALSHLAAIDRELANFEGYDWNAAFDADITAATKLQHHMQQLGADRSQLVGEIQHSEDQRQALHAENHAKRAKDVEAVMAAKFNNWGDSLKTELGTFAVEQLGYDPKMVTSNVSEADLTTLYYANIGYKAAQKVKAEEAKAKAPKKVVKPVKSVKQSRQSAPKDLSRISDPEAFAREYRKRYNR